MKATRRYDKGHRLIFYSILCSSSLSIYIYLLTYIFMNEFEVSSSSIVVEVKKGQIYFFKVIFGSD